MIDDRRYVRPSSEHKAVNVVERQPLWGFAPQHVELVSKDKVLGFQRSPRPEQSDEGAPDQPAKVAHRQRVSTDSWSRSAVFEFALGTAGDKSRPVASHGGSGRFVWHALSLNFSI
jgi:hypothetical protein